MKIKALILSMVLVFATVSGAAAPVFDEPIFGADGVITLNAKTEGENQQMSMRVYRKRNTFQMDDLVAVLQGESNEEGKLTFVFRIPETKNGESTNGTYVAEYNLEGKTKKTALTFDYVNFEYLLEALGQVTQAEEVTTLLDKENEENRAALGMIGFDMSGYDSLSEGEQTRAAQLFLDLADSEDQSKEKLCKNYETAVGITLINKGDINKGLAYINPLYGTEKYSEKSDGFKSWVPEAMKKQLPVTAESLDAAYKECCEVYTISNALSSKIGDIVGEEEDIFGFADSRKWSVYASMNTTYKGYVHDKMAELLVDNIYTYEGVVEVFETAVDTVADDSSSGGSSGGSGGGGGGSRGGSVSPNVTTAFTVDQSMLTPLYKDIEDYDWAEEAILALSDKKILSGYGDRIFAPEKSMTREEFVKVLVLAAGVYDETLLCSFSDVTTGDWYYSYVASAVHAGLVKGISEERFGVGEVLTRQDMAVLISRAAEKKGVLLDSKREYAEFTDEAEIADYAKESVRKLYCSNMINGMGDGGFAPTDSLTRAQAAKVVYDCFFKN